MQEVCLDYCPILNLRLLRRVARGRDEGHDRVLLVFSVCTHVRYLCVVVKPYEQEGSVRACYQQVDANVIEHLENSRCYSNTK